MLRTDPRPLHQQMSDGARIWGFIIGLSVMLIVWSLIAYAAIGPTTLHHPFYNLPDPIPASQPYNRLEGYPRLRR